jgi:hypothetical protein
MKSQKLQIYQYIFDLNINENNNIVSSIFTVQGKRPASMSHEEFRQGQIYQQEIFGGRWDWLIEKEKDIVLSIHNIVISVVDPQYYGAYRFGGGSISSNMKMVCEHCGDPSCDFHCTEALKWALIEDAISILVKSEELKGNKTFNNGCDALESMILAHAIAGVHVDSDAYIEGIVSALDAMGNQ